MMEIKEDRNDGSLVLVKLGAEAVSYPKFMCHLTSLQMFFSFDKELSCKCFYNISLLSLCGKFIFIHVFTL